LPPPSRARRADETNGSLLVHKHVPSGIRTTETSGGKAVFTNDCLLNRLMFVTIKRGYGKSEFIVKQKNSETRPVTKGDTYSARCGVVVPHDARYVWMLLRRE
jgi:hypothetical protein